MRWWNTPTLYGMTQPGHVFVIDGDVSKLACDAWLLPTDHRFSITRSFCQAVGMPHEGALPNAPKSWNGQGCLFLGELNRDGQPDLWLGDIGRHGASFDHFVQRAAEFIVRAATKVRRDTPDLGRPPLLAMNVIGSGHGGKRSDRGGLLAALLPAIHETAHAQQCDVALVAYGPVMYAAAQAARRSLEPTLDPWAALPEHLRTVGDMLASHAKAGGLVVFMGAGVSVAAGVPAWRQLLEQIGRELGTSPTELEAMSNLDPRDQATVLKQQHPDGFAGAVQKAVAAERPSLLHGLLASLPVKEFVTTNFDELFESAATTANRQLAVLPGNPVGASDRWLLKLHGTLGKDLILTRDDYLGANARHVALRGLVQAMLMTRHMIFVGYSLSDEDFHQLVHEVRSSLMEDHATFGTALMPAPHAFMQHLWNDVSIVDTSIRDDPTHVDTGAARRLAMLLDYVGSRAASDVQFVADDSLGDLRSEDEAILARLIADLTRVYTNHQEQSANAGAWSEVKRFLDLFPLS